MDPKMKKPLVITSLVVLVLVLALVISIIAVSVTGQKEPVTSEQVTGSVSSEELQESSEAEPEESRPVSEEVSSGAAGSTSRPSVSHSTRPGGSEAASQEKPSTKPVNPPTPAGDREILEYVWKNELAYLASMQLSNGALPMTRVPNGTLSMNPYFADTAAEALLTAGRKYQSQVKKYIVWHMDHINTAAQDESGVDGTIYDYEISVKNNKIVKESIVVKDGRKHYDSTDSYAATFLSLLRSYAEKTGDKAFLQQYYSKVNRIYSAMIHTMSENHLTGAKPSYNAEYLMDNCEVYKGAADAAWLYRHVYNGKGDAAGRAAKAEKTADGIQNAIHKYLWKDHLNAYLPSLWHSTTDWNTFYADATCQLFPALFGVDDISSGRSKQLYEEFNRHYGNGNPGQSWQNIDIPETFFWGLLPRWASVMGDNQSVVSYAKQYKKVMKKHAYPLYNADIGHVAIACYNVLQGR